MSSAGVTSSPVNGRELSYYGRVRRGLVQPTMLGVQSPYPAIHYDLADILGYVVLTAAATLQVGSWYFFSLGAGAFGVYLPPISSCNDGDAVGFANDANAPTNNAVIYAQGTDLITAQGATSPSLICNVANDRFRLIRAAGQWNVA